MKTTVVYESATGNTAAVARAILAALPEEAQGTLCGPDEAAAGEAQLIFAGFWTDKGSCSPAMAQFLTGLHGKRVALFGTAGFGGSQEYFDGLLERVAAHLPEDCVKEGGFMCQGKMPHGVRKRYEAMLAQAPEDPRAKAMIENFDRAASHPDGEDLRRAGEYARKVYASAGQV